jgi:hypothetical protein
MGLDWLDRRGNTYDGIAGARSRGRTMSSQSEPNSGKSTQEVESVVRLTVGGFKSLREEQSIELRPLTVLAGANSAGKSSIMQPFLLLKQTLEAKYTRS